MTKQNFPFYFLLQERAKPILPPHPPPTHPPIPPPSLPQRTFEAANCHMRKRSASSSTLLLLPTLGATLDISIDLCLALLIRFFEELDVLIVTVIIFFESALDFFKFLFNVRDLKNTKRAKPIDDCRAFLHNFLMHILELSKSKWIGRRAQTFERRRRQ